MSKTQRERDAEFISKLHEIVPSCSVNAYEKECIYKGLNALCVRIRHGYGPTDDQIQKDSNYIKEVSNYLPGNDTRHEELVAIADRMISCKRPTWRSGVVDTDESVYGFLAKDSPFPVLSTMCSGQSWYRWISSGELLEFIREPGE